MLAPIKAIENLSPAFHPRGNFVRAKSFCRRGNSAALGYSFESLYGMGNQGLGVSVWLVPPSNPAVRFGFWSKYCWHSSVSCLSKMNWHLSEVSFAWRLQILLKTIQTFSFCYMKNHLKYFKKFSAKAYFTVLQNTSDCLTGLLCNARSAKQ